MHVYFFIWPWALSSWTPTCTSVFCEANAMPTATPPPTGLSLLEGLLAVQLQTFSAIGLGYACVRLGLVEVGSRDMKALHLIMGRIGLPLLVFKVVATADLGEVHWGVVIACILGKIAVFFLTFITTWKFFRSSNTLGQRLLTATIFGFFTAASNDFACGLPVVHALYGDHMTAYIAANVFVFQTMIQPFTMVMLEVGRTISENSQNSTPKGRVLLNVFKAIASNSIILATVSGLAYQALLSSTLDQDGRNHLLPHPLREVIDLLTQPYTMTSLFLSGAFLTSSRISFWPAFLMLMKVVVCAYMSYSFCVLFYGAGHPVLNNFTFFYGTIPTGGAPLVLGSQFDPASTALIASASLWGLVLAAPIEVVATLFLGSDDGSVQYLDVHRVQMGTLVFSVCCGGFLALVVLCSGFRWGFRRWAIAVYGLATLAYSALCLANTNLTVTTSSLQGEIYIYLVGVCQTLCRFFVIFLEYLRVTRWRPSRGACPRWMLAVVIFSFVPPLVVRWPNTIHELLDRSRPDPPSRAELVVLVVWDAMMLVLGLCLTGFGTIKLPAPASRSASQDADALTLGLTDSPAQEGSCAAVGLRNTTGSSQSSPAVRRGPRRCNTGCPPAAEQPPDTAVVILVLLQALRLIIEGADALVITVGGYEKAGFTPMVIIANVLEHSQGCAAFAVLFTHDGFKEDMHRMYLALTSRGCRCTVPSEFPGAVDEEPSCAEAAA